MKIRVTLEIADATRRALRRRDGGSGMATRREMLSEFWAVWDTHMEDICADGCEDVEDEIEEGNECDEM